MRTYRDLIKQLATAPDNQLDPQGAKMCAEFDGKRPLGFLRDLLDLCVRYAWSSGFIICVLEAVLSNEPPEHPEMAEARRKALLAKWEPEA